jgi:hypothetical protein
VGEEENDPERDKAFYATVGELVLLSTTLDAMLNTLLIETYRLGDSVWLNAIIGTLDATRKIEIIKRDAGKNSYTKVSKSVTKFLGKVEIVIKQRNIVCHTPPTYENGSWSFRPTTAAKILNPGNVYSPTMIRDSFNNLKVAISTADAALKAGSELIKFYKQQNADEVEYYKRLQLKEADAKTGQAAAALAESSRILTPTRIVTYARLI